jgi:hypothetical protein
VARRKPCVDCGTICQAQKEPYRCRSCRRKEVADAIKSQSRVRNGPRKITVPRVDTDRFAALVERGETLFPTPRERYVRRLVSEAKTVHGIGTRYVEVKGV